jgi:putative salt-induced outer membrane protein YdiY
LRSEAERTSGPNSYRFEGRVLYARQYLQTTSDRYDGQFRFRHELSQRIFSQAQTSYTKDRVKLIEHNAEQNFGLGYKFLQRPRYEASFGGGLTAQYRSAQGIESGISYLGELFQDYTYKLTGRLTITQDANVSYSPETRDRFASVGQPVIPTDGSATNYRLRFNTALQGKVTEKVSLNLRFEYEFDNAILDPRAKVDQRVTTSIGYGF